MGQCTPLPSHNQQAINKEALQVVGLAYNLKFKEVEKEIHLSMTIVEMCVHMDCQGCERKIRKALQKIEGVQQVKIDMERQKVTVTGRVNHAKVLKAARKTGRKAVLWPYGTNYSNCNTYTSNQQYYNRHYHPALAQNNTSYDKPNYSSYTPSYKYFTHGYGGGYENSRVYINYAYHYPPQPEHPVYSVMRSPSYKYFTHGYGGGYENSRVYGNYAYHYPLQPEHLVYSVRVVQRASDMFSDENPNACSIM